MDSSQNSQKVQGHLTSVNERLMDLEQSDHLLKYVLQDPTWLLMANADEKVMMGFQLPTR